MCNCGQIVGKMWARTLPLVCIHVCDRFVVPNLSVQHQALVAESELALDVLTRTLIRDRYECRFATTPDGGAAVMAAVH
jgi:hypothetical protein